MRFRQFVVKALLSGLLVVIPAYVAVLLLFKVMNSLTGVVQPLAMLMPEWLPAGRILSFLLVLFVCFLIGLLMSTRIGRSTGEGIEKHVLQKLPGYTSIRGITERLAGESRDESWKPALAEIEDALVPVFIIEELEDGRFTVFVPSVPTPFAGAIYILSSDRVHPVDVPFKMALKVVTQWGAGTKDLVAAMEKTTVTASAVRPRPGPRAA